MREGWDAEVRRETKRKRCLYIVTITLKRPSKVSLHISFGVLTNHST